MRLTAWLAIGGVLSFTVGCGADSQTGSEVGNDAVKVESKTEALSSRAQGFFRLPNGYVVALYNSNPSDLNDWRFHAGSFFCHVYDTGSLGALSIVYGFSKSNIPNISWNELADWQLHAAASGAADVLCPWPNGMIGRVDVDGGHGVYLIQYATYYTQGTLCWLKNGAQVGAHGGWGAVWSDPSILNYNNAHLEDLTNYNYCSVEDPNSCHLNIQACR